MNKEISELREKLKPDLGKLTCMEVDDQMLKRYLIAFGNVSAAYKGILSTNAWRSEFNVANVNAESPGVARFHAMKASIPLDGYDKSGRPVLYCPYRNYNKEGRCIDQLTNYIIYLLETLINKCREDVENICIIVDFKDFTLSSMDYGAVKALFVIVQNHYPERLGCMFFLNAPAVCSVSWTIVKVWLNERTRNKINFLKAGSSLDDYIDPAYVPLDV